MNSYPDVRAFPFQTSKSTKENKEPARPVGYGSNQRQPHTISAGSITDAIRLVNAAHNHLEIFPVCCRRKNKKEFGLYITSGSLGTLIGLGNEMGQPSTDANYSGFPGNPRRYQCDGGATWQNLQRGAATDTDMVQLATASASTYALCCSAASG